MSSIADLIKTATQSISRLDAELLLAHILEQPRSFLFAHADDEVSDEVASAFASLSARRARLEPLAYIVGKKSCWSRDWLVTSDTLIPRPETEVLIEFVLTHFQQDSFRVADLGTGSGVIAVTLAEERPHWEVVATDISEEALMVAKQNAALAQINQIAFYQGDWCQALPSKDFDMIVSNPPYIAESEWKDYARGLQFEPRQALVSGADGLQAIQMIGSAAFSYLKSGGYLVLEHGFLQGEAVRAILASFKYQDITTLCDLEQRERVTYARFF